MYEHENIGGYEKNQFMGGIKITVAKEMRDARDSYDQGKRPISKYVNREKCGILYQIIGRSIYICACLFDNIVKFDDKVRQFCAFLYQSFYMECCLSPIIISNV